MKLTTNAKMVSSVVQIGTALLLLALIQQLIVAFYQNLVMVIGLVVQFITLVENMKGIVTVTMNVKVDLNVEQTIVLHL